MTEHFDTLNVPHTAKLRVADFMLLNDAGAFDHYSKSELIEGEIICMNAQYSRHARIKSTLMFELENALRAMNSNLSAWCEVSIHLSDDSMPEPDIVLTSYRGTGAVPLDTVALIVEVADTTLDNDLGRKARLYARAGVAEYWVVNVEENRALLHTDPTQDGYAEQIDVSFGEPLMSGTISGLSVPTDRLA
jgi:Uma2 family endonuclease